jgi:transaldolase
MSCIELECDHVTVLTPPLLDLLSTSKLPPHVPNENVDRISSRVSASDVDTPHGVYADSDTPSSESRVAKHLLSDPFANDPKEEFVAASTDVDYLADGVLDKYNEEDKITKFRLEDAITTFRNAEKRLFEYIEEVRGGK